jgi:hypothetical protein
MGFSPWGMHSRAPIGHTEVWRTMTNNSWVFTFGIPSAAMLIAWLIFLAGYRKEMSRVAAWPALLLTSASCWSGLWALFHLESMWKRASMDYGFEARGFLLGVIGGIAAIVWLRKSRQYCSVASLLCAVWSGFFFMCMLSTM